MGTAQPRQATRHLDHSEYSESEQRLALSVEDIIPACVQEILPMHNSSRAKYVLTILFCVSNLTYAPYVEYLLFERSALRTPLDEHIAQIRHGDVVAFAASWEVRCNHNVVACKAASSTDTDVSQETDTTEASFWPQEPCRLRFMHK